MSIEKTSNSSPTSCEYPGFRRVRIAVGALLLIGLLLVASAVTARRSPFKPLSIFARVLAQIETSYVEPVDQSELVYGAIRGMMSVLDPHTTFLDPEEFGILEDDTEGTFRRNRG